MSFNYWFIPGPGTRYPVHFLPYTRYPVSEGSFPNLKFGTRLCRAWFLKNPRFRGTSALMKKPRFWIDEVAIFDKNRGSRPRFRSRGWRCFKTLKKACKILAFYLCCEMVKNMWLIIDTKTWLIFFKNHAFLYANINFQNSNFFDLSYKKSAPLHIMIPKNKPRVILAQTRGLCRGCRGWDFFEKPEGRGRGTLGPRQSLGLKNGQRWFICIYTSVFLIISLYFIQ